MLWVLKRTGSMRRSFEYPTQMLKQMDNINNFMLKKFVCLDPWVTETYLHIQHHHHLLLAQYHVLPHTLQAPRPDCIAADNSRRNFADVLQLYYQSPQLWQQNPCHIFSPLQTNGHDVDICTVESG